MVELREMIKLRNSPISIALDSTSGLSKVNLSSNTLVDGINSLTKLEILYKTIVIVKEAWEECNASWKDTLKNLKGSTSSGYYISLYTYNFLSNFSTYTKPPFIIFH